MKKKYYLIPIIAIVLAVLAGLFVTFFTTPVLVYLTENSQPHSEIYHDDGTITYDYDDYFYTVKKTGKIMRFAYKLNPSQENLEALAGLYSTFNYIQGTHKGNTPPPDYLKNCVKYQKLAYELDADEADSTFASPVGMKKVGKFNEALDYAKALYLNGQVEESEIIVEDLYASLEKEQRTVVNNEETEDRDEYYASLLSFRDYFYLVYSSTENVTVKKWVLNTEALIEKDAKKNEKINHYIGQHGYLFSNPDYDTYVSGKWPESQFSEYLNYFSEERYNEEKDPGTQPDANCVKPEPELNNWPMLYYRRVEGIYTVLKDENGKFNELALITNEGEVTENGRVLQSFIKIKDGEIRYAYPVGNIIWFLGGNTIYRLYTPTGQVDKIYDEVKVTTTDDTHCFRFLYPISNYEIEWIEAIRDDEQKMYFEKAYYYRSYDNYLVEKEYSFATGVNDFGDLAIPERNWWREGDQNLKQTQTSVYITIDRAFWPESYIKSLKECKENGISYVCYPVFNGSADMDKVENNHIMEIQQTIEKWLDDKIYSENDYGENTDYKYYVESTYDIVGNRTVIRFVGEKEDRQTNELHSFNSEFTFDFVVTDKVKGLNSFDNNYLG